MPSNGMPMNEPVNFSSIQRPPRTQEFTAVPVDSIGGAPGAIHDFTVTFQAPTMLSSFLCASPGVDAFIHASICAFCMSSAAFFVSSANRELAHTASTNPRVRIFRIVLLLFDECSEILAVDRVVI